MSDETTTPQVEILTISNKKGLHASAAAKFVQLVNSHNADVRVARLYATAPLFEDGEDFSSASGGSVLGILTLGAEKGTQIRIEATGDDADKVLAALKDLINRKFDEE